MAGQRKIVVALVALLAALLSASATQAAEVQVQECIRLLAGGLAGARIAPEVRQFLKLVRTSLPGVPADEYATLVRDTKTRALEAAYPGAACYDLLDSVDELTMKAIGASAPCRKLFSEDEEAVLEVARADPIVGPVYEAKEACFAFPPPGKVY